jgi:hypothetical protein
MIPIQKSRGALPICCQFATAAPSHDTFDGGIYRWRSRASTTSTPTHLTYGFNTIHHLLPFGSGGVVVRWIRPHTENRKQNTEDDDDEQLEESERKRTTYDTESMMIKPPFLDPSQFAHLLMNPSDRIEFSPKNHQKKRKKTTEEKINEAATFEAEQQQQHQMMMATITIATDHYYAITMA